jgi:uncharacterized 2Fe-2S/4Fe-4S cluster protein (DUF4445 family)
MKVKLSTGQTIQSGAGQSLLDALKAEDIYLVASCGGKGTCGKCKVRVIEGDAGARSRGKLTGGERERGMALACQSFPLTDLLVEIPESSRLTLGGKIAYQRAEDLRALLDSFAAPVTPLVKTVDLRLPPPTLHDNISDLERLRRALAEVDLAGMRFSHRLTLSMARALRKPGWRVTLGYIEGPEAVFIAPQGEAQPYGLAVDIGTTTVVVYLVDLTSGVMLDMGSTYNSQMRWGDDVITRIVHATEGGGLEELRRAVVTDINDILRAMVERRALQRTAVESVTVSGNTTMTHLFWGLDPGYIREEPYIPTLNTFPLWRAGTARLSVNPEAPVYTLPCVASYVGGDIVSGVLASRMHRREEVALFMDIGTNGEVALGNNEWIVTAACSAGPCFEGSGIRHGMRATDGAVEGVSIDRKTLTPSLQVIGGGKPRGICGSGMIDAVGEMFLAGILDQGGKLSADAAGGRIREGEDGLEFVFFEEGELSVTLTEVDIENIIRAKAAIYAGVSLLLGEVGLGFEDIERVYIAGGFGTYLKADKAIVLGMLPDIPLERFSFLGNTSAAGAYLTLLSGDLRAEAEELASRMTYIELSVSRGFMDEYMSAMFLPHTDLAQFPTVEKLLAGGA